MHIQATVEWDPEVDFEQSKLLDIILTIGNGQSKHFNGVLKRADTTIDYLRYLYVIANMGDWKDKPYVGEVIEDNLGKRIYKIPIKENIKIEGVLKFAERIEKKHYISPRDEWVSNEEYCTFFGSSGSWDIKKCDYPSGNFVETLKQTVYDMEHNSPKIFLWSNVPRKRILEKRIKVDSKFKSYAEKEIYPLIKKYENEKLDIEQTKQYYKLLAEVTERYENLDDFKR